MAFLFILNPSSVINHFDSRTGIAVTAIFVAAFCSIFNGVEFNPSFFKSSISTQCSKIRKMKEKIKVFFSFFTFHVL